jgi:hypothetical protein
MDTVSFVLALIGALALTNIASLALAARFWYGREAAQREITRLVAQSRPRSPHTFAAGYDTGLREAPYGRDS